MIREEDKNIKFVNPYNFVPLQKEVVRAESSKGDLSGVIKCSLKTKTPLFIPNVTNSNAFYKDNLEHKSYDYYSYQNNEKLSREEILNSNPKPIIPGSEIRGMIRSVYETLTNSCIFSINNKPFIGRYEKGFLCGQDQRLRGEVRKANKAGVLIYENDHWQLHTAHQYEFMDNNPSYIKESKDGDEYYYDVNGKQYHNLDQIPVFCYLEKVDGGANVLRAYLNKREGQYTVHQNNVDEEKTVLLINGRKLKFNARNKKDNTHASIFVWEDSLIKFDEDVIAKAVQNFTATMIDYADPKKNKNLSPDSDERHYGYKGVLKTNKDSSQELDKSKHIPVWIIEENGYIYFTPSRRGKYAYNNTIEDFITEHMPCTKKDNVCAACNLFGFIGEDKNDSLKGRLKFFDANVKQEENTYTLNENPVRTLRELAGPSASCQEFYTNTLNGIKDPYYWNYDIVEGQEGAGRALGEKNPLLELNGRKYYWHNQNWNDTAFTDEKTKRNLTVRPVRDGIVFDFEISFKELKEDELSNLIFCLNLGDNEDNHCHKIGGAKPLGFGSIKIAVEEVLLKNVEVSDESIQYSLDKVEYKNYAKTINEDVAYKQLMQITDFDAVKGAYITYPIGLYKQNGKESDEGYVFFFINKSDGVNSCFHYTSPKILKRYNKKRDGELADFMSYNKLIGTSENK